MLIEELDLTEDSFISIDLPPGWQAVAIALGTLAAGIPVTFFDAAISDVVFVAENAHKDATKKTIESDAADPSEYSGDGDVVSASAGDGPCDQSLRKGCRPRVLSY